MAEQDQKITSMLDTTLGVLGGGADNTTTDEGANLVQEWIFAVRSDVSTQWVADPLEKLRDALYANDMRIAERTLLDLSGQTIDLANNTAEGDYKTQLQNLSTALKTFALALGK